jgi:hypothetical protein
MPGREITIGEQTQIANALLVLRAGQAIDGDDQVVKDGVLYEVVGPPGRFEEPGLGEHHVEVNLRTVTI